MRTPFPEKVERGRMRDAHAWSSSPGDDYGAFFLRMDPTGPTLKIIASAGDEEIPWDHVSVSTPSRCPTWEEMAWIKDLFFTEEETVVQYHPPKSKYVNYHPYCLHLWRPHGIELPLPPTIAVGPAPEARHAG